MNAISAQFLWIAAMAMGLAFLAALVCLAMLLRAHRRALAQMREQLVTYDAILGQTREAENVFCRGDRDGSGRPYAKVILSTKGIAMHFVMIDEQIEEFCDRVRREACIPIEEFCTRVRREAGFPADESAWGADEAR